MCLIAIKNVRTHNIRMQEAMSILLATTVLALGGMGLYLYKSTDEHSHDEYKDEGKDEEVKDSDQDLGSLFGGGFWGLNDERVEDVCVEEEAPRKRRAPKTQRNRKSHASSRRKYY